MTPSHVWLVPDPNEGAGSLSLLPPVEPLDLGQGPPLSAAEKAVLYLVSRCDGARAKDGAGLSRDDAPIGRALARKIERGEMLDEGEKREAARLGKKYKEQLKKAGLAESDIPTIKCRDAADVITEEVGAPMVLLGDDDKPILTSEDLTLLHAREGVGKSWLALLLSVLLAVALAGSAGSFLGIPVLDGGAPVLLVSAELSLYRFRRRLLRLTEALPRGRLHVLTEADTHSLDLMDEGHAEVVAGIVREVGARLLVLDPSSEVSTCDESNAQFSILLNNLKRIRATAGCGVLLASHERKGGVEGGRQGRAARDSDSLRGGTRLRTGSRSVLRLEEERGLIRLSHTKSNLGGRWPDRWLDMSAGPWAPRIADAPADPAQARKVNVEAVVAIVEAAPDRWLSVSEIREGAGCPPVKVGTLAKYLQGLVKDDRIEWNGGRGDKSRYRASRACDSRTLGVLSNEEDE